MKNALRFATVFSAGIARAAGMGVRAAKAELAKQFHDARLAREVAIFRQRAAAISNMAERLEVGPGGAEWMTAEERDVFRQFNPVATKLILKELGGDLVSIRRHMSIIEQGAGKMAITATANVVAGRRRRRRDAAQALARA